MKETKSDLEIHDIIETIEEIMLSENTKLFCMLDSERKKESQKLRKEMEDINKYMFMISIYEYLSPRRCILDYKFTSLENGLEKCFLKMYHPKLNINSNLNINNIFFMIDLDGTLINSDILHYQAYKEALLSFNQSTLDLNTFNNIINNSNIDIYLKKIFNEEQIIQIKELKQANILKYDKIEMMKNSDKLINYIYDNKINHVVVTNTNSKVVENFKQKLPILKKLSNWCTRTDYVNPKPDPECYLLGKKKFFSNEKFIIGIENTIIGYKSLKNVTDCIYLFTDINNQDYNDFKNKDAFLINDFLQIFTE
jgi:beta-phosphoglucomutase-like phosphatase (HAD superfamily)